MDRDIEASSPRGLYATLFVGTPGRRRVVAACVGGGFILVPAMIYLLGMPARVVVGTSLVMILAVSAATTMVHSLTTRAVDIQGREVVLLSGYAAVSGVAYGFLMNLWFWPFMGATAPAGATLGELARDPNVIALSMPIDDAPATTGGIEEWPGVACAFKTSVA